MSWFSAATFVVLLIITTSSTIRIASFSYSDDAKLSAYEALQQFNFPVGILPKGVTGYDLNTETGVFAAYLNTTCKFSIDSYELEYKPTITGVVTNQRLYNLKGVKVKVLFLWLSIVEVVRDGDEMEFSVGIASANFPLDSFYESPQCGCGFYCHDLVPEGNANWLLSSSSRFVTDQVW